MFAFDSTRPASPHRSPVRCTAAASSSSTSPAAALRAAYDGNGRSRRPGTLPARTTPCLVAQAELLAAPAPTCRRAQD